MTGRVWAVVPSEYDEDGSPRPKYLASASTAWSAVRLGTGEYLARVRVLSGAWATVAANSDVQVLGGPAAANLLNETTGHSRSASEWAEQMHTQNQPEVDA